MPSARTYSLVERRSKDEARISERSNHLGENNDSMQSECLKREAGPVSATKFGIRLPLTGGSLSDTISALANSGVDRYRTTVPYRANS